MDHLIRLFFDSVVNSEIQVYNEFSLQHELGIFLRKHLGDFKIEFERNVSHFGFEKANFIKREVDISIYIEGNLHACIELKYPRNGQVPEQMFSFIKDLKFLEQLTQLGFSKGYLIILTEDPLFYSGKTEGIYKYFRASERISGEFIKPTGLKDETIRIERNYNALWQDLNGYRKYCLIEV